jgi:hypothetical protein
MTNISTLAAGGTSGSAIGSVGPRKVTHEINLADLASTVTTGGYAVVASIPAGTYFRLLAAQIVTTLAVDAATQRIDLGDTDDDDEFVSNHSTATAGTYMTLLKGDGSLGDVYTSAKEIRMKLTGDKLAGGTANATGIVRFVWLQMDASRNAAADT